MATVLPGLVLAAPGPAQHRKDHTHPMPLLRTPDAVSPWQTFEHLRTGNAAAQRVPRGESVPPRPRPYGPGRRLAAVALPAGLTRPAAEFFAVRHRDLLVFSSPGPSLRNEEIAALEHAVRTEQVSVFIVLVDPRDRLWATAPAKATSRRSQSTSIVDRSLGKYRLAAADLARRQGIGIPTAHGILQADEVYRRSPYLAEKRLQGRFQIAVGLITDRTRVIRWVTKWHKRWRLVSSASAEATRKLLEQEAKRRANAKKAAQHPPKK